MPKHKPSKKKKKDGTRTHGAIEDQELLRKKLNIKQEKEIKKRK
jgi:hypothetical protein